MQVQFDRRRMSTWCIDEGGRRRVVFAKRAPRAWFAKLSKLESPQHREQQICHDEAGIMCLHVHVFFFLKLIFKM